MKGNTVFKIFSTLLIAVIASFAVTAFGDDRSDEYYTLSRDAYDVTVIDPITPATDIPMLELITEPEDTTFQTHEVALDTVFVTDSGTKYHRAGCSYLRSSANEISFEEAEEQGYTPCSRCFK